MAESHHRQTWAHQGVAAAASIAAGVVLLPRAWARPEPSAVCALEEGFTTAPPLLRDADAFVCWTLAAVCLCVLLRRLARGARCVFATWA